jgi:hypothetical protein
VLRLQVERDEGHVGVTLFGDDGELVAAWVQPVEDGDHVELSRSHDGVVALVVVDDVITAVGLADSRITASGRAGRGIEASLPLDERSTLEIAGELTVDGGHTGHQRGGIGFFWADQESPPDRAEFEADVARLRAELAAAASRPIRRRLAVRHDTQTVLVHEACVSPADGGEVLLWPPIAGPAGVLLRHAIVTDNGANHEEAPQLPWLVQRDGTVARLPFELGVSPLLAMEDGRWLLPGADVLWRDDYDEPLSVLDAAGSIEPLLVGGRPVSVSRVLQEAAPELLAALEPIDPNQDVPWETVSARLDTAADELLLSIEIRADDDTTTILVVGLSLPAATPARVIVHFKSTPRSQIAVAP